MCVFLVISPNVQIEQDVYSTIINVFMVINKSCIIYLTTETTDKHHKINYYLKTFLIDQ